MPFLYDWYYFIIDLSEYLFSQFCESINTLWFKSLHFQHISLILRNEVRNLNLMIFLHFVNSFFIILAKALPVLVVPDLLCLIPKFLAFLFQQFYLPFNLNMHLIPFICKMINQLFHVLIKFSFDRVHPLQEFHRYLSELMISLRQRLQKFLAQGFLNKGAVFF